VPLRELESLSFATGCFLSKRTCLSNDRVRIQRSGGDFILRNVPVIAAIREQTFEDFPWMKKRILEDELHFRAGRDELLREVSPRNQTGRAGQYDLSPVQFCSFMGATQAAEG